MGRRLTLGFLLIDDLLLVRDYRLRPYAALTLVAAFEEFADHRAKRVHIHQK